MTHKGTVSIFKRHIAQKWGLSLLCCLTLLVPSLHAAEQSGKKFNGVHAGMTAKAFLKRYPKSEVRSFRRSGDEEWITFNDPLRGPATGAVTFYFKNDVVLGWMIDDRTEIVEEYLQEFCSLQPFPVIFTAIKNVLLKMPYADFLRVTDRRRPIIFTEFYDSGTARFASSQEYIVEPGNPPCCSEGFTLIKVGLGLGAAASPGPIEGVMAHEIAHRVLDHVRNGKVSCTAEREANALIKEWGFREEFKAASSLFGGKEGDPASCQEEKKPPSAI